MPTHEVRLVRRAVSGDQEACDGLVRACRPWLVGYCRRLCGDEEGAQDLAQETFCRAWASLSGLHDPAAFRAWLARIALNAHRSHDRRHSAGELPYAPERLAALCPEAWPERHGLAEALARLEEPDRRLLLLVHGEGYSYTEAAQRLAISPQAARSRLHRARERARRELREQSPGLVPSVVRVRPPRV